jgi:mRNA-degrading endonuclease RelE of RelBE toxin-antitoxin system
VAFEIKFTCDAAKDVQRLDGSIKQKLKDTLNKKLAVDPDGYGTPLRAELGTITNTNLPPTPSFAVFIR